MFNKITILVGFEIKSRVVRKIIAVILPVVTTSFTLIPLEHPISFTDELINDLLNLRINKIIDFSLILNVQISSQTFDYFVTCSSIIMTSIIRVYCRHGDWKILVFQNFEARLKLKTRKKWKIKVERVFRAVRTFLDGTLIPNTWLNFTQN